MSLLPPSSGLITQMMEAVRFSETSVASNSETSTKFYQTTRCYIQEDNRLFTRRRVNLKSQQIKVVVITIISIYNIMY
jgi:hypothetical protein